MELLEGHLEHIVYRNEENGYTVGRFRANNGEEPITITGTLMGVQPGENLICKGDWKNDKKYGMQFIIQSFEVRMPTSAEGIEQYLGAGQISGIGPAFAKRIVDKFGTTTFEVLDQEPDKLLEVEGLGKKTLERIKNSWREQQNARTIVLFLQQYSVSPAYAKKIFRQYGQESVAKIKENPYRLAEEVVGIGFKKADEIARQMGIEPDSAMRVDSGIDYFMMQLNMRGHSCYPLDMLTEEASQMLKVSMELIQTRIGDLVGNRKMVVDSFKNTAGDNEMFIWRKALHFQEKNIVTQIRRILANTETWHGPIDGDKELETVTKAQGITLAEQQEKAVAQSIIQKLHIITGGPGTGKSTITKVILGILGHFTDKIQLAAPTGRAAKRLTEITGREASTIHSLLSLDFTGDSFLRSRLSDGLSCDVLIIDEASMIDTALMSVLLDCLPDNAKLILVGDVDQLPSVGPGNVLRDLIDSEAVPVTRLTEIFRQATNSKIVMNAHKINNGLFPDISIDKDGDFFFIQEKQPEKIAKTIENLVGERLKKAYQFHPLRDIQVLCPMHKGPIGTIELNRLLQQALNDPSDKKEKTTRGHITFSPGDKVMQIRNNYDKGVYNGDIGIIKRVKMVEKELLVEMDDGKEVEYEFSELSELEPAYAVTVHKYQGSEAPCIIIPVHESQYSLLFRNLLYTGVTRGKKLVILVGTKEALSIAVQNDHARDRFSALYRMFDEEQQQSFPEIKIVPMLGSEGYEDWVALNSGE